MVGGVMAYRRLMPVLELRLRTIISRENNNPLLLIDGMIADPAPPHRWLTPREPHQATLTRRSNVESPQVEITDPSEPSVINWITEAEQKLHSDGRIKP
jgi:hypothetical protein